jgi:hypothetical protein
MSPVNLLDHFPAVIYSKVVSVSQFVCLLMFNLRVGWEITVGIATGYALDGPGIEFWWGMIFCTRPAIQLIPGDSPW